MTIEDPKPGNRPGQASTATQPSTSAVNKTRTQKGRPALVLAMLAILAVGGGLLVGYHYWSKLSQQVTALNVQVDGALEQQQRLQQALQEATNTLRAQASAAGEQGELLKEQRHAVSGARTTFGELEQRMAEEQLRLQEREAELRAALDDVYRRVGSTGTQWILAESEHLLEIANQRLVMAGDTETARVALELADERLGYIGEPGWAKTREQIARDIDKLRAFESPDPIALSAELNGLIGQVAKLRLAAGTVGPERTLPHPDSPAAGERSWQTLLADVGVALRDSVRIRDRDQPVRTMLAPEREFFLYENLKLHLEAARLALARTDQAMFREQLRTTATWLTKYADPREPTTHSFQRAIEELLNIEIQPLLPDVSQSLTLLRARREQAGKAAEPGVTSQ